MKKYLVFAVLLVMTFTLATPIEIFAGKPPKPIDWREKISNELDMAYAEDIIRTLGSMGTSDLGFRGAGSSSEIEAAEYVRDEFVKIGLEEVTMEPVPVHAWEFRGASLTVYGPRRKDDYTMISASFGGSPGTPKRGITGELVYVGDGFHQNYVGVDVEGKIVLANWIGADFWVDSMAFEATYHGAAGIVVTTLEGKSTYGQVPDALVCHDGLYSPDWVPMISIQKEEAAKLITRFEAGETLTVTMKSDITLDLDGTGYNVVGYLPGEYWGTDMDEFVIIGDHIDAWFEGALDDNSGVAAMLVLADAFMKSGYQPERTLIFVAHCAEEYGITDTYFDWCYGAWYQITHVRPEWAGRAVAFLVFECLGLAGAPLTIDCVPEVYALINNVLARNRNLLPYGWEVAPRVTTWADHWTYSASGIPGIEVATWNDWLDQNIYHTQLDTISIIDFNYLEMLFKVWVDLALELDQRVIVPYVFETMATTLWKKLNIWPRFGPVNPDIAYALDIYEKYGIDTSVNFLPTLELAKTHLEKAQALDEWLKSVDPAIVRETNAKLMNLVKTLDTEMIAMGVWEQSWFPHEQSLNDVVFMERCIEILDQTEVIENDVTDTMWKLNNVGIVWYYDYMCKDNYLNEIDRLSGSKQKSWGTQTHLLPIVDVWDEYDALANMAYMENPQVDDILVSLKCKQEEFAIGNLETAFNSMWTTLQQANSIIDDIMQ